METRDSKMKAPGTLVRQASIKEIVEDISKIDTPHRRISRSSIARPSSMTINTISPECSQTRSSYTPTPVPGIAPDSKFKEAMSKKKGELKLSLKLKLPTNRESECREQIAQEMMKESKRLARQRLAKANEKAGPGLMVGKETHFEDTKIIEPGVTVWKVCGRDVELVPYREHGRFYERDSYLIVSATPLESVGSKTRANQVETHVHFWLGKHAEVDKYALAAIRAVQLSYSMEPRPVKQHREVQGEESKRFIEAFAKAQAKTPRASEEEGPGFKDGGLLELGGEGNEINAAEDEDEDELEEVKEVGKNGPLVYLEGGSESMLVPVHKRVHSTRLYKFKGKKNVRVTLVELSYKSLNSGDAFLLDAGYCMYTWYGSHSNWQERSLCAQAAVQLKGVVKRECKHHHCPIYTIMQGEEPEGFWIALGVTLKNGTPMEGKFRVKIADEKQGGDDLESERSVSYDLYEIDLNDGKVEPNYIDQDEKGSLYMSQLNGNCVYVLDAKTEIFIYVGASATPFQREVGMQLALEALQGDPEDGEEERPRWATVKSMIHPYLHPMFALKFADWFLNVGMPITYAPLISEVNIKATNISHALAVISNKVPEKPKPDAKARHSELPLSPTGKEPVDDEKQWENLIEKDLDGDIDLAVYEIKSSVLARVPDRSYGSFVSDRCYTVLCVYSFKKSRRYAMFFWQGRLSAKSSYFVWHYDLMPALVEKMYNVGYRAKPKVARVFQNAEPAEFLTLFDPGILVLSQAPEESKENSSFRKRMFHIRGADDFLTRTHEVPCKTASLNSTDAFVVQASSSSFFIWYGSMCNQAESKRAARTAIHIYQNLTDEEPGDEEKALEDIFHIINEGQETDVFWLALGGKGPYAKFTTLPTEDANELLMNPRLYSMSMVLHHLRARPIQRYSADNLTECGVFVLDMYCMVFVWCGDSASHRIREASVKVAQAVAKERKNCKAKVVQSGREPSEFTHAFQGWHEVKPFVDPYAEQEAKLIDIGVQGRVLSEAEAKAIAAEDS
ncbi:hypothetical protein AAMO2058_000724900 [Amorphochlora amoebiformis]